MPASRSSAPSAQPTLQHLAEGFAAAAPATPSPSLPLNRFGVPMLPALTPAEAEAARAAVPSPLDFLAAVVNLQAATLTPEGNDALSPSGVAAAQEMAACVFEALPIPPHWTIHPHGVALAALAVAFTAIERAEAARYDAEQILRAILDDTFAAVLADVPDEARRTAHARRLERQRLVLERAFSRVRRSLSAAFDAIASTEPGPHDRRFLADVHEAAA